MGKYQLEYDALNQLADEFKIMDNTLKSRIKDTAKKIGQDLKSNTERAIPKGKIAKHGIHMADEVKLSVSTSDTKSTITVKGGKKTGGLWWLVDNGHIALNGRFVDGAHFTEKAYKSTDVETPVDALIQGVLNSHE